MRVRPVVNNPAAVVGAVAESTGEVLLLHSELDVDVYRLRRSDPESDLVARAFGPDVERATVDTAARVLQKLAGTRFPAERCPSEDSGAGARGRPTCARHRVHRAVTGSPPGLRIGLVRGLLGRLANRSADDLPPGGGWHRLGPTPSHEIDQALSLGGQVGPSVAELVDTLADADDGVGLPEALIHADLTPPNAIPQGDQPPVIIDWVGVGRGPRIWPLAFLLFVAGPPGASRH